MKKILVAALVLVMLIAASLSAYAASGHLSALELDNKPVATDAYINYEGPVYLPLRATAEALGYKVSYAQTDADKIITAAKDDDIIQVNLTKDQINANGHTYYMGGFSVSSGIMYYKNLVYLDSRLYEEDFGITTSYEEQNDKVGAQTISQNPIYIKPIKFTGYGDSLNVTLQYPQFYQMSNATAQQKINDLMIDLALAAQKEGLKNAYDLMWALIEGYDGSPNKVETYFDYHIKYNQNNLLSIVLTDYQYAGGAHGLTVQSSYNFDLATGQDLKLSDIMKSNSGYISYINSVIKQEIDERAAEGGLSILTPFETITGDQQYYLSNQGIVIYFQQYEYFPYAAGIQEFTIRYADLAPYLKSDYSFLVSGPQLLSDSSVNNLAVGNIGRVVLKGNTTTGYTWHYKIGNEKIISLNSESFVQDAAAEGLVGAGGTYTWDFKALKAGQTSITFKYYRDWEGEASVTADNIREYQIVVK